MNVGFIGLGRMGMPMARNLLKARFPLTVHNRSRIKVDELTRDGARPASSPAEVTMTSDIILTCLPDVATSEEVFLGERGVVESVSQGQILIDCSTVGPETSRRIAQVANSRGAVFLDAPLSGGVERAVDGTLTIMVGGEEDAYQRSLPVLEVMGSTVRHVGGPGTGSVMKLINQLLVGVHTLAASEAMILAVKSGVDPKLLLEILGVSWGNSFMLSRNGPMMLERTFDDARGPMRLILKDMQIIDRMAQDVRAPLYTGREALAILLRAADQGLMELDLSAIVLVLERETGVKIA